MWEFPLQNEESIVTIGGLSDADAAGCPITRRSTSGGCLRVGQHTLATWSSIEKVVSLSSAESEYYSMVRCARPSDWPTLYESWDTKLTYDSRRMLQQHAGWLSAGGAAPSNTWRQSTFLAAAEREEPGAQDREDPWHNQLRRLDDEASGWKAFDDVV